MVVLDEVDDRVASTSQVILNDEEHELIQTETAVEDSIGEEIIVDKSNACSKKRPYAIFSKSRAITHHQALANQHLSNVLRVQDITTIFNTMTRDFATSPESFANSFLYGIGLLLLGRDNDFYQINLILEKLDKVSFDKNLRSVRFPIVSYKSKTVSVPVLYRDASEIEVKCSLPQCIQSLVEQHLSKKELNKVGLIKRSNYDAYLEQTFADHPYYRTRYIADWVFHHYFELSSGDVWQACLITEKNSFLNRTILHYASMSQAGLNQLIAKHWQLIDSSCDASTMNQNTSARVGSPFFPKTAPLRELLSTVRNTLNFYLEMLAYWILPSHVIVEFWNLLVFYTDQCIAYTCATRNTQDPFIRPDSVMLNGWTLIDDKHIDGGRNAREVYVSDNLRQQLETFLAIKNILFHKTKDRSNVPLVGLKQTTLFSIGQDHDRYLLRNDLFLLKVRAGKEEKIVLDSYTRKKGVQMVHEALTTLSKKKVFQKRIRIRERENVHHYKENTNRHFLRGILLELSVSPVYINSFMGHYHQGTEPWGGRSMFNPQNYRKAIEQAVPQIEQQLALKPLRFLGVRSFGQCGVPSGYLNHMDKEAFFLKNKDQIIKEAVTDGLLP